MDTFLTKIHDLIKYLNVFEVLAKGHRRIVTNMAGDTI
jgi:hypothetical protein